MADGIRKRLTQSGRRVERFIHSFEAIGLDVSGDGKAFTKEAFRPAQMTMYPRSIKSWVVPSSARICSGASWGGPST